MVIIKGTRGKGRKLMSKKRQMKVIVGNMHRKGRNKLKQ